jgi:hypothetical protein
MLTERNMHRRRRLVGLLVIVAALVYGVVKLSAGGGVAVRPLTLTVLEAGTRRPLAGVHLRYAVEAAVLRGEVLGVLPSPESVLGWKIVAKETGVTDENGQWRTGRKALRLSGSERLDRELVFVNLEPDFARPAVQDVLDGFEWQCREDGRLCGNSKPDATDVLREVIAGSVKERSEILRNPDPVHLGALVLGVGHGSAAGARDWSREGECFRVQWAFGSLGKDAEELTVELEIGGANASFGAPKVAPEGNAR